MAAAVAGEVLGPRPGKAICSFWQGTLEIVLWIATALFGCVPALISAAVGLAEEESQVSDGLLNSTSDLVVGTRASSGLVIAVSVITIILLTVFIVLRVCNIGALNLFIKGFLSIVIIINIVLLLGHLAGGVLSAYYAADWGVGNIAGNSLASAAAFSFLAAILLLFSVIWDAIYLGKEWNDKVVKYTIKEAVMG